MFYLHEVNRNNHIYVYEISSYVEYFLFQSGLDVSQAQTDSTIIELQPDNEQSQSFWLAYKKFFEDK